MQLFLQVTLDLMFSLLDECIDFKCIWIVYSRRLVPAFPDTVWGSWRACRYSVCAHCSPQQGQDLSLLPSQSCITRQQHAHAELQQSKPLQAAFRNDSCATMWTGLQQRATICWEIERLHSMFRLTSFGHHGLHDDIRVSLHLQQL